MVLQATILLLSSTALRSSPLLLRVVLETTPSTWLAVISGTTVGGGAGNDSILPGNCYFQLHQSWVKEMTPSLHLMAKLFQDHDYLVAETTTSHLAGNFVSSSVTAAANGDTILIGGSVTSSTITGGAGTDVLQFTSTSGCSICPPWTWVMVPILFPSLAPSAAAPLVWVPVTTPWLVNWSHQQRRCYHWYCNCSEADGDHPW